jgi:hypothetical protein
MGLLPLEHLLRRRRLEPRSRADDLTRLRARFSAQPSARHAGDELVASAARLRALRREMAEAYGSVDACSSCAKGGPEPHGHWHGGWCCGGHTLDLFSEAEVASLKLAGVSAGDLEPPRGDHAGCAFRGATSCSLRPEQRPNICVRYICLELRAELIEKPEWRRVSKLGAALRDEFARFEALREASIST